MNKYAELARSLRSGDLEPTELADGTGVVLHLRGGEVYSLNETGMFIVDRLTRGEDDPDQLAAAMARHFEIDLDTARRDLDLFVDDLHRLICT
jgi:hypothetical protein